MLLPDILNRLVPELDQEKMQPVLDQILAEENRYVAEYGGILFPGEEAVSYTHLIFICSGGVNPPGIKVLPLGQNACPRLRAPRCAGPRGGGRT